MLNFKFDIERGNNLEKEFKLIDRKTKLFEQSMEEIQKNIK
jgi:hypothetical protein